MIPYKISSREFLKSIGIDVIFEDFYLQGLYCDSRLVCNGSIFFLFNILNKKYLPEVIKNGAKIIFIQNGVKIDECYNNEKVTFIHVENVFHICALIVSKIFYQKPEFIFGVTGTNGKTSVVDICRQMWGNLDNFKSCSIGTLGVVSADDNEGILFNYGMTTPDVISLNELLWRLYDDNYRNVAIEVSSHGLEQERIYGINFNVIAFTNITQDHLDYHKTFENYFNVKLKFIRKFSSKDTVIILNTDIHQYEKLLDVANRYGLRILTYGYNSDCLKIIEIEPHHNGQNIKFLFNEKSESLFLPLFGKFQAYNFLCAFLVLTLSNINYIENFKNATNNLKSISGRMEYYNFNVCNGNIAKDVSVFIDYAHTPDGLKSLLSSVRWHFYREKTKIILIFGCGGDRDKLKRPIMGAIACEYADFTIISDDNPRMEQAQEIRAEIISGFFSNNFIEIPDRKEAIKYALFQEKVSDINNANLDTIIVIAGKGHENYQIIGNEKFYFNDIECVKSFCNS